MNGRGDRVQKTVGLLTQAVICQVPARNAIYPLKFPSSFQLPANVKESKDRLFDHPGVIS